MRLSQFFKNVSHWPRSESEAGWIADRARDLLEAPYAIFWSPEFGAKASGAAISASTDDVLLQVQKARSVGSADGLQIRQFQMGSGGAWNPGDIASCLAVVPMFATTRPDGGTRDSRSRQEAGWILVGSPKALGAKQELCLLAAAEHCAGLASLRNVEASLSMRDQFLSIASHELKTPLTSIYGILQLQERMLRPRKDQPVSPEQEKQRSFFKIVIRQVERLNELIDGLLDVSRIQNGRFMVEPSDTDAAAILRDTVQSRLSIIAQDAGVRIQVESEGSLMSWLDPVRFEEVVTNLGMNAIRFSPEGGVVWIKLRQDEESTYLSVRDQGPAVPEADKGRIFQPFERAQRTARLGGLGLGLFISRQIAQLHGGDVALTESIAGRGNLFTARFPRRAIQRKSA